jgi:hypothetical protein
MAIELERTPGIDQVEQSGSQVVITSERLSEEKLRRFTTHWLWGRDEDGIPTSVEENLYGASGFTTTTAIREILEPRAQGVLGGARSFAHLDADSAALLVTLLPASLANASHQGAPTLKAAAELTRAHGGRIGGYWIVPPRSDEGVFVNELIVPEKAVRAVRRVSGRPSERETISDGNVRLWWD